MTADSQPDPTPALPASRRDRLRARSGHLPVVEVPLPLDPAEHASALDELERAEQALQSAQVRGVPDLDLHRRAVELAEAAVAAVPTEVYRLQTLRARRWEELLNGHPPQDEERELGAQWHTDSFRPALLAEVVLTPDGEDPLDATHWEQVASEGQMTPGELTLLFGTAVGMHLRQPRLSLGKG